LKKKGRLQRRVVSQISEYPDPKQIFQLITRREWPYSVMFKKQYGCRDRALMSFAFVSGGRITAIVGGPKYERHGDILSVVAEYAGLKVENVQVLENLMLIKSMRVVKRSRKLIERHGLQVSIRDEFAIPLEPDLFENPYWDQLMPFGWLILEYLEKYAPDSGSLFLFKRGRAWQIINSVTDMYPNYFRALAEHFYGHYLLTDSVKLAKFVKVVRPEQIAHYIGYSWKEQLKDVRLKMDFDWIQDEVVKIQKRLGEKMQPEKIRV